MIETIELHPKTIRGPFSFYLNGRETSLLTMLVDSVKPKVVLEFGCNVGMTAKRVLENIPGIERYVGVDVPFDHKTTLVCQSSEVPLHPGCYADDPRFWLLIADRELTHDDLEPVDAVFIDGDHSFDGVMHDSRLARELIRSPGIIVWHDFLNPSVDVTKVLDQLSEEGWPIVGIKNSWLAFTKI